MKSENESEARFVHLFEATREDLLAYAIRRTRSPEDAADVIGETYLIAWRKLDSIPGGSEARLWLFGVARNVLLRGVSRERTLQSAVGRLASELRELETTQEAGQEERTSALRVAVLSLPEPQREALLLTAWEGLTPREIAAVTGTPVNLVRVRLHRARLRLKRALTEAEPTASQRASPTAIRAG